MLVIDDFNEMVGLETLFRRLGFDVLSFGREMAVSEGILGFPPDLVVAVGRGRHVNGFNLAPKIRYGNTRPKLVVLVPQNEKRSAERAAEDAAEDAQSDVDAIIETPFDPREALSVVAQLLNLEPDPILEKYGKIVSARLFEPQELKIIRHQVEAAPMIHVTSVDPSARNLISKLAAEANQPKPLTARESRYAKFLDDKAEEIMPPIANGNEMRNARKKLEQDEANASMLEIEKAAKIQREKREFVRAMIETAKPEVTGEVVRSMAEEHLPPSKKK